MKITVLVENVSEKDGLTAEHGLSLFIENKDCTILFDTGASAAFAQNADKMEVDLAETDLMILSHGHYDHGGGIRAFLDKNNKAKLYFHYKAFGDFYSGKPDGGYKYIGLDQTLLPNTRFVFTDGNHFFTDDLELFSDVLGNRFRPSGNGDLLLKTEEGYGKDDFSHEQNLILRQDGKSILIAGCAHNGIVNILERYQEKEGCFPDVVIGGFHLYNRSFSVNEDPETVEAIADFLIGTGAKCYTCHCTGIASYNILKKKMGEQIGYLSTGSQIII